jgi:hypothetical protein
VLVEDEPLELDVILDISIDKTVKVVKCVFSRNSRYCNWVFWKLGPVEREEVHKVIVAALLADVTPSLYSLYHCGNLIDS